MALDYSLDPEALSNPDFSKADNLTQNEDGSVDVELTPQPLSSSEKPYQHDENLAETIPDEILAKIARDVLDGVDADIQSSKPWSETIVRGLDLLGIQLKELNEPFIGACSATHPLILESAVKFQAKASKELFPPGGPVKTQIKGKKTPEKQQKAVRVMDHMNYQINEQMTEYFPDMERLLLYVPIVGLAFKKVYYDERSKRPCSEFVPADQLIVPANAVDLKRCSRYTHILYKNENDMLKDQIFGTYRDVDLGEPSKPSLTDITKRFNELIGITSAVGERDSVFTLYEQHVDLTLEDTEFADPNGLALPYVVTVDRNSQKVLSIRRNWKPEDPEKSKQLYFVAYPFVPGFGFYSIGFVHLLGNFELTLTACMRSLVDSGQFATLQGGWKAKGIRLQDNSPHKPGEWKDIEAAGMDITKALVPLQYKEPSQVLMAMLEYLEGRGQKFADSTEQVISDSTNYGPVGTTLALLEASTKFFSGIHKRLHYAQKQEFRLIAEINSAYISSDGYPYDVVGGDRTVYASDYDPTSVDVIPCSDPNISSNAHRMSLAQTKLQVAQQFPQKVNVTNVLREFFDAMGDGTDVNDMVVSDSPPPPPNQDPVSDIAMAVKGQPISAYQGQDHESHIKVKQLWLEDPQNGKNPVMTPVVPLIQSNIRDHMVHRYQEMMAGAMQNNTIQQQQQVPDGSELAMVLAAQQVSHANTIKAQVEGTQDPMLIAALAQKQEAENVAQKIEYDHMEAIMNNATKEKEIILKAQELGLKDDHFKKKTGSEMLNKSIDRVNKTHDVKLKNQTQLEIAKLKPSPSSSTTK